MSESDIKKTYKVENGVVHIELTLGNRTVTCDNSDTDYRACVNELLSECGA